MSKLATLLLITVLLLSSLVMVEAVSAQSYPKPSVPEFDLKFIDNSYDVPPTYEIDPYTGENVTQPGYHALNKSIQVIIKDPPPSNYGAFYNVRYKGHFEDDESWSKAVFSVPNYPQSLVITFVSTEEGYYYSSGFHSSLVYAPSGGQVDFQVRAMNGYYSEVPDNQPQLPWSTGYLTVFIGERSGWSETQIISIPENIPLNPVPTSTPIPHEVPEPSELEVILGIAITVAVLAIGLGLLVYRIKRK